jgi:outer membrane lipoprotein-sorting protein
MNAKNNEKLDELIWRAISREAPKFEFDKWKRSHKEEIQIFESQTAGQKPPGSVRIFEIGKMIMKSRVSKIATAAAIIIAILTVTHFLGHPIESIAWADVVRPILTAHTVVFNIRSVEGENLPITRIMNMGTQRVRSEVLSADGKTVQVIAICDYDTSQMLQLIPGQKTATFIELKDIPEEEKPENILEEMRNIITELQNDPDVSVEALGEKEMDGRTAKSFRATGPDGEWTVWADTQTSLPIRMEQKWRQVHYVYTDFQFDAEMDESLFSIEVPEGYSTLPKATLSLTGSTEQDLVETLRVWTEVIREGVFPKDFSTQEYMNDVPKMRKLASKHSQEQNLEYGLKMARGFVFFKLLKAENDWHYVGENVKLGDAESAVCWYRPTGSETCRVIYGDLSVKDVAPENLPK